MALFFFVPVFSFPLPYPPPAVGTSCMMVPPNRAANKVPPVESKTAGKRGQGARGAAGAAAAGAASKGADSATTDEPPMPMKKDGHGKKVVDKQAHARMFPGGAVLMMKNFQASRGEDGGKGRGGGGHGAVL